MLHYINKISTYFFFSFIGTLLSYSACRAQISKDHQSYTVQQGETLPVIAKKLGNRSFAKAIYAANSDLIDSSGSLKAGQKLILPASVTNAPKFVYKSDFEPDSAKVKEQEMIKKFKSAFEKVVNGQKQSEKPGEAQEGDPVLELGGFVLDETRSKMGRDFYDLFYQNWQSPENTSSYTITISEQPSPGLGSVISIKVDYEQVYSARLQPRYDYIKAVSNQAIARCRNIIQEQASIKQQLSGY